MLQRVTMTKMERLMMSLCGIQDLEEFQCGPEGRTSPLFHSWNTKQFGESPVHLHLQVDLSVSSTHRRLTFPPLYKVKLW